MTLNTTLGSIGWNANHGVCIQDFETTIQPYLTASHLWGTLNFSAPWNRVTYIYDTAIGDNPNVIESFLARPGSPEHALFSTLRDFIQSGIVQCLIRDKIQIGGEIVTTYPTVSSLYDAWMKRDGNTTGNFLTQRFGNDRTNYNRSFDQLLSDYPGAVKYYDPNIAKPLFRTTIRDGLSAGQALLGLVEQLPADVAFEYRRMCAEKEYMTTVDLWNLVRPYARSDEAARQLLIMQGYVNQHSIAQSVSAGISGSDWGHSWRPSPSAEDPPAAMTPTDVFDQADLSLSAPAIELLASLSPNDVKALRQIADKTLFDLCVPINASQDEIRRATVDSIIAYWELVCEHLDTKYPGRSRVKTRVFGFIDKSVPTFKHLYSRSALLRESVDISASIAVAAATVPGAGPGAKGIIKRMMIRLLYQPTPEFAELKALSSTLWRPQAAWARQNDGT